MQQNQMKNKEIFKGALNLKNTNVNEVMTLINDVFTLSSNTNI